MFASVYSIDLNPDSFRCHELFIYRKTSPSATMRGLPAAPPNTNSLQGQLMCVVKNGLNWSRYMQWMDNIWSLPVAPKHTGTKSNHFWFTSGHIIAHKSSIWSLPVNFRSHHSPNRPNMLYPVTSGKLPVHLDKPVIITVTSGLWPQKASDITEVNNLKVSG